MIPVHRHDLSWRRPGVRVLSGLVSVYQNLTAWKPSPCRFVPSCSNYAQEALVVHGALRGTGLTIRRLARCHPWGPSGPDPVPKRT